jgi:hypothetical protein
MKKFIIPAVIAVAVLAVAGVILWFTVLKPEEVIWQETGTYVNEKLGYGVSVPVGWTVREFPDTKDGAGFRPADSPEAISSECITIAGRGTAEDEYNTPFEEYVERAAIVEIQGITKLDDINEIKTYEGLKGYEATWVNNFLGAGKIVSLPIAYFENKKEVGGVRYKTVQIELGDDLCRGAYEMIVNSFRLIPPES